MTLGKNMINDKLKKLYSLWEMKAQRGDITEFTLWACSNWFIVP